MPVADESVGQASGVSVARAAIPQRLVTRAGLRLCHVKKKPGRGGAIHALSDMGAATVVVESSNVVTGAKFPPSRRPAGWRCSMRSAMTTPGREREHHKTKIGDAPAQEPSAVSSCLVAAFLR